MQVVVLVMGYRAMVSDLHLELGAKRYASLKLPGSWAQEHLKMVKSWKAWEHGGKFWKTLALGEGTDATWLQFIPHG